MSSKAAEARESFLRRLEQQNQQQRQQQEEEEGKAEEKEELSSNKEGGGTNYNVKESDNVQVLKPTAVVEGVAKKTKERAATTKSSTTPTKDEKVPQLEEEESKQEATPTFFNTPAPPSFSTSKEVEEERLILKSIVKSCGLSQVSELGSIDPSSLKLLRTLSTPRVKRHLSDKKSKSTSAKAQQKDEEKGEKFIPRNIDFDAEKEEEKQKEAPFSEIALDKSIALNRTTSDLTAFNTDPSKLETSLSLINDNDDSSDTEDDEEDELIQQEEDVNTEATTAGSKQQQDELIRRHRRRSKRHLLPTEKSTKTITTSNVKVDVETLEPWQQHLFDMLKQQQEEMKEMSEKIDNLTAMIHCQQVYSNNHHQQHPRRDFDVQHQQQQQRGGWEQHESYRPNEYPFQYSSSDQPPTQQQQQDTTSPPSSPNPPTNLPPQRPYTQPQPPLPPNFIILPLLTKLFTFLFSIPTSIYTYLTTTRFVRICTCFVREARRRNDVHANLDIHLLFKLLFVCFLFGGRISSSSTNKKDEKKSLSAFLDYYRMYIFVGVGIVVYLIQSGIAGFVYEFFWKGDYVRMIWNNEDLKEEGEEEEGEDGIGDGQQGDGEGDENEGQRRGQQDRDVPDNNNNNNEDGIAARGEGGIVARRRRRVRTIADGGIRRRPLPLAEGGHGENVAISFLHDVKYLVGGLFLSLLPTWRPELVEDEEEEEDEGGQAEGEGGNEEAVVAVDGGNDGQNNDGN